MKKKTIRIITFAIVLTLLLSTAAFAAMNASAYIAATNAWITRSGNTVKVNFSIVGTGLMDNIGVTCVDLYERNGNCWDLVETFDYTDPDYDDIMMASSTHVHGGYLSYSGSANKSYYASVSFYAERNGGSDTYQQNTPTSHGTN